MKSIAKSLIKIANELDTRGHTVLADRLDQMVWDMTTNYEIDEHEVKVSDEPVGSAAKRKLESQQMLQVQKLINRYLATAETIGSPPPRQLGSSRKSIPENGKTGDHRTWTYLSQAFGWVPGKDYRNYAQLAKLLKTEIDKLMAQDVEKLTAAEGVVLQSWDRLIDLEYDPADAKKYRVTSFDALLDMLQNLPQQRGADDALHRVANELVYLAKEIMANPAKSQDLVEWLDAFITDAEATETEEEA